MNKTVTVSIIGAGNRGLGVFGQYALDFPHMVKVVSVVEKDEIRRNKFSSQHNIDAKMQFSSDKEFFSKGKISDAVIISTQEDERVYLVYEAIKCGYHILVEKPLACNLEDTFRIYNMSKGYQNIFSICHQMRYIPGYALVKSMIDSGKFGSVVTIQHSENLSYHHMAHSFVRGPFNNDSMTPMILAKSCHDMDILRYLIDKKPTRVSSFGSLNYFKKENAPKGCPDYCIQGCPEQNSCPYDILKIYFNPDTDPAYIRHMGIIEDRKQLLEALKHNRFGRCVFKCDNNVVDHQIVNIEFEDGITANFQMAGHNYLERRITKISLTNGEIIFDFSDGLIKSYTFSPICESITKVPGMNGGHMGGDKAIMDSFVNAILIGNNKNLLTSVEMSIDSHLMAFASEMSRRNHMIVELDELIKPYFKE